MRPGRCFNPHYKDVVYFSDSNSSRAIRQNYPFHKYIINTFSFRSPLGASLGGLPLDSKRTGRPTSSPLQALEGCRKTLGEDDLDTRSGGVLVGLVGPCWLGDHGDLLLCDLEVRVP